MRLYEFRTNFKYLDQNMKGGLAKNKDKLAIKELQEWLNLNGYDAGKPDGIYGKKTVNAVKKFQADAKIKVDGDAGSQTIKAMLSKEPLTQDKPKDNLDLITKKSIVGKTNWKNLIRNQPFNNKFTEMQEKFPGLDSQEFATMIQRESSFDTKAYNSKSGAAGLFQFIPKTARSLGTTSFRIRRMPAHEQLAVYDLYMQRYIGAGNNAKGKLAMLQAAPAYANDPDDTIIYKKGSRAWRLNPGWRDDGGDITVGSIKNYYKVA